MGSSTCSYKIATPPPGPLLLPFFFLRAISHARKTSTGRRTKFIRSRCSGNGGWPSKPGRAGPGHRCFVVVVLVLFVCVVYPFSPTPTVAETRRAQWGGGVRRLCGLVHRFHRCFFSHACAACMNPFCRKKERRPLLSFFPGPIKA